MKNNQLRIKTKKDWCIAAVFAFLLLFVLSEPIWNLFLGKLAHLYLEDFMMLFYPDKMTYANYPGTYGNLFAAVLLMTILVLAVCILYKKGLKCCLAVSGAGILISLTILAAFHIHCRLIVSTAADNSSFRFSLHSFDEEYQEYVSNYPNTDASNESAREIARLCYELKPLPEPEQKAMQAALQEELREQPEIRIWIIYPEKYGHTFWLSVVLSEQYIYIRQTQGSWKENTYYEDNGLYDFVIKTIKP